MSPDTCVGAMRGQDARPVKPANTRTAAGYKQQSSKRQTVN